MAGPEPRRFVVPPYVGVRGWIGLHLDRNDDARVKKHVREAYSVVAPAKLADAVMKKYTVRRGAK